MGPRRTNASLASSGPVAVRSAMSGFRTAGNAPGSGNEGVGEHVRTKFHFDREATRETAEPETGPAPNEENLFLLPDRN